MLEPSLGLSADSYHRMHAGDGEDAFALPLVVSPDAFEYVVGGRQVYLQAHTPHGEPPPAAADRECNDGLIQLFFLR